MNQFYTSIRRTASARHNHAPAKFQKAVLLGFCCFSCILSGSVRAEVIEADVVIFGGTSGGIAAAVQAKRMGKTVALVEWTEHLGGLTTGGLGATDIGNKAAIGGIAREFYEQIAAYYDVPEAWKWEPQRTSGSLSSGQERGKDPLVATTGKATKWTFEPHVAKGIYLRWLRDLGIKEKLGERLKTVTKEGRRIIEFTTESGNTYRGKMFIDASYEGDLMAKAKVSYHIGREANALYGETINGVRASTPHHQFKLDVDPFLRKGDPASGLLPFIQAGNGGVPGEGDRSVQAYNFRLCMTHIEANRVAWSEIKPANYDADRYELLARYIEAHEKANQPLKVGTLMNPVAMPNGKTDTNNNNAFSTDFIGANYDYPDGDYATRERIWREHEDYTKGFLYFLSSSERVPKRLRDEMNTWGLARDEFIETGHFPSQMYVREARRMISDYVMTEADCRWNRKCEDPVGLGAYNMDSHNCQRIVQNGWVRNEGDVQVSVKGPYPVSYRSIVPKADQVENLLVPVALSATHIAYGSIRMEPVFMAMGQSAATAAVLAIDGGSTVQAVNYAQLRERLLADRQVLDWTAPARVTSGSIDPKSLAGWVMDDTIAEFKGDWTHSTSARYIGEGYHHDGNVEKGERTAVFRPIITEAGSYELFLLYAPLENRATNVPVSVKLDNFDPPTVRIVNQRKAGANNEASLGVFKLNTGLSVTITIRTEGTDGFVVVDGLQIVPQR